MARSDHLCIRDIVSIALSSISLYYKSHTYLVSCEGEVLQQPKSLLELRLIFLLLSWRQLQGTEHCLLPGTESENHQLQEGSSRQKTPSNDLSIMEKQASLPRTRSWSKRRTGALSGFELWQPNQIIQDAHLFWLCQA